MSVDAVTVMPLGAQVVFFTEKTENLAEWETGTEAAVSNSDSILIATQEDLSGDVDIRVSEDEGQPEGMTLAYECELDLGNGQVRFGSILSNQIASVALQATGRRQVQVYVDPVEAPAAVEVRVR